MVEGWVELGIQSPWIPCLLDPFLLPWAKVKPCVHLICDSFQSLDSSSQRMGVDRASCFSPGSITLFSVVCLMQKQRKGKVPFALGIFYVSGRRKERIFFR